MYFIIMGAGAVGVTLASQLVEAQHDVVLIERDEAKLASAFASQLDLEILHANGCSPETLIRAGLHTADYFIAVADNDEANITACLTAKLLNPAAKRIARIRDINLHHKDIGEEHIKEHFDLIINPEQAAAEYLFRMFKVAGAREVLEFCDGKLQVVALNVQEQSPFINKRLRELARLKEKLSMLIIAIIRDGELVIPRGNDILKLEDTVYCVVPPDKVELLFELVGLPFTPAKHAMVWGGGKIGRMITHELEAKGIKVKLIVDENESSVELVDEFKHILVLHGDGKDQSLLVEENVKNVDAFISVTEDEEENILGSLLAKKLGARTTMALVNQPNYLSLVHAIGVDVVVSSRAAAASAIFSHIHSDSLVSEFSFRHLGAGFVEVQIDESVPIIGKELMQVKIPNGIIVAAINRGDDIIIPSGVDILQEGDSVVLFVTRNGNSKLEKLFGMTLEFIV